MSPTAREDERALDTIHAIAANAPAVRTLVLDALARSRSISSSLRGKVSEADLYSLRRDSAVCEGLLEAILKLGD